jgi:hypothetical protein
MPRSQNFPIAGEPNILHFQVSATSMALVRLLLDRYGKIRLIYDSRFRIIGVK